MEVYAKIMETGVGRGMAWLAGTLVEIVDYV